LTLRRATREKERNHYWLRKKKSKQVCFLLQNYFYSYTSYLAFQSFTVDPWYKFFYYMHCILHLAPTSDLLYHAPMHLSTQQPTTKKNTHAKSPKQHEHHSPRCYAPNSSTISFLTLINLLRHQPHFLNTQTKSPSRKMQPWKPSYKPTPSLHS